MKETNGQNLQRAVFVKSAGLSDKTGTFFHFVLQKLLVCLTNLLWILAKKIIFWQQICLQSCRYLSVLQKITVCLTGSCISRKDFTKTERAITPTKCHKICWKFNQVISSSAPISIRMSRLLLKYLIKYLANESSMLFYSMVNNSEMGDNSDKKILVTFGFIEIPEYTETPEHIGNYRNTL